MYRARPLLVRLTVFAAVIAPVLAFASIAAQSPAEPKSIIKGVVRYERRGVSGAPPTGIVTGVMMGGATAVGMQRAVKGVLGLLAGAAALTGNPSITKMNDFLRSTDQIDMSGWPVKAEYGADLFFTLEGDEDGAFHLADGSVTWSTRNNTRIELAGKGGNVHILHDKASGQGSSRLTPENSSITIRMEGTGESATFDLDLNVTHPMPYQADALWSAMGGLVVIRIGEKAGTQQSSLTMFGQTHSDPPSIGEPSGGGFGYFRHGPLDSLQSGREVWLNFIDSPERIEYELFTTCTAEIEHPVENDELVFDDKTPAKIEEYAGAKVLPDIWSGAVRWVFPDIEDSRIEPAPADAAGDSVPFSYVGMPVKNAEFKFGDFKTGFDSPQAKQAGCEERTGPVAFFFDREAQNNPGKAVPPPGNSRSKPDPNWFYYWNQTKAAQGHAGQIRYGDGTDRCDPNDYGAYRFETSYIVVCDLAANGFASFSYPGLGPDREYHGVDVYGVTIRHEWQHYLDYQKWWGAPYGRYIEEFDKDGDRLPDAKEDSIVPPPPLNKKHKSFDPEVCDSALRGLCDEHTFAWAAEYEWATGSADAEDWSCPGGHQAFSDKCAEIYQVSRVPQ